MARSLIVNSGKPKSYPRVKTFTAYRKWRHGSLFKYIRRCIALKPTHFFFSLRNYSFINEACSGKTVIELGINNLFSSKLNAWFSGMLSATIIWTRQMLCFHFLRWYFLWLNISGYFCLVTDNGLSHFPFKLAKIS